MKKNYVYSKTHRRLQKIRNWFFDILDTKLAFAAAFFMVVVAILFDVMVK